MRLIQSVKEKIMKNGLPEGYTRLEYLQSTGVQYIDTGYKPNNNTEYEVRGYMSPSGVFGVARWSGDPQYDTFGAHSIAANALDYYGRYSDNKYLEITSDIFNKPIIWKHTKDSIVIKGLNNTTYVNQSIVTDSFQSTYNMWVFGFNNMGTLLSRSVGCKINSFRIWDNNTLIRDFVPALDPSDKPCMYDLVSKQPFYNLGTGADFSIGKKLIPVEYIANTGSSYINTGYNPNSTTRVETKFKMNESPTSFKWLFLSRAENVAGGGFGFGCITNGFISSEFNERQTSTDKLIVDTYYIIDKNRNLCTYNNKTLTNANSTFSVSYPLPIFALNNMGTITSGVFPLANCYYFRIYDNDVLVRDLIPVRDDNNVGYMLDLLTNTLYANAGSGSFAIGEDDLFVRNIGKTKFFKQTTRKVPKGFQEVEYLESTGTQYIDIGLKGKNNLDFEYKCEFTNLDGTAQCVGGNWSGQGSSTVSMYFGLIRTNGNLAYHYDGTASPVVVMNTTVQGTPYSVQGHLWKGEQYFVINGTKSSVGTIASEFTSSLNMYLFGINNNGLANPAYIKLHYFKLWDNGILVRDFVPYLDASGRPCMWDTVEGKPYYNLGSDEFTCGRKIIPVEYLESTGTQYIDAGFTPNQDSKVELTYQISNDLSSGFPLFGSRTSASSNGYSYQRYGAGVMGGQYGANITQSTVAPDLNKHTVVRDANKIYLDGTEIVSQSTATFTCPGNLYINAMNNNGTAAIQNCGVKYFGFKYWNNSGLGGDFIPAIDENNTPYMFDKVTHSAFLNQGTGNFLYGNPVGQRTETLRTIPIIRHLPLNYLESTGTQYINTGLVSTADSKVDCTFGFSSMESGVANNVGVFGGRNGQQSTTFTLFKIASGTPQYFRFDFNGQPQVATANQLTWDTTSKYRFEYDGTKYNTTNTTTSQSVTANLSPSSTFTTSSICLFAVNTNGTIGQYLSGRIYHYWYTDGTNTIDLYPVLKLPERIPCMYDRVSKTYFYNESTDQFLYG